MANSEELIRVITQIQERSKTTELSLNEIKLSLKDQNDTIKNLEEDIESKYVSITRYSPVEKIVYGMVGLILVTFATALISLVIMK